MAFQYDPNKAASNFKKHGVSSAEAENVFTDPLALEFEDSSAEGEERYIVIGLGFTFNVLVVVYTLRSQDIRLISARRATKSEVKAYEG